MSNGMKVMALLGPGMRAHWRQLVIAFLALLATVALRILEPWPLQYVLDHVITDHMLGREGGLSSVSVSPASVRRVIIWCAAAFVAIAAFRALADYYRTVLFSLVGNRIVTDLRGRVYQHVQNLSLGFHQQSRGGDLTLRLVGDLNMMKDVAVSAALPLVSSCLLLVGMFSVMLWLNWKLGLMVLCVLPAFWLVTIRGSRKIHSSAKQQRRRDGALAATAAESLAAVQTVQAMNVGEAFSGAFQSHNSKSHREGVKTSRLTARLERTVDLMIAVASALVLWKGAEYVLEGSLTPGQLVVYLTYLKRGFKPMQDIAKYTGRLSKAMAAGDRILELLDRQPEVVDAPNAIVAPPLRGRVRFDHVQFSYDDQRHVFSDLSFTIQPGEQVAIVGPSGIGKSTLLSLILRLYDPAAGRVLVDDTDIRHWTLGSLRERISVVLQDNAVFATSVRDNIAIAVDQATDDQVIEAARCAMADEFIRELPDGYDTVLGERGVNLSQGQRQRLAIARAALRKSAMLLLDEPTSSLDPENRTQVISALGRVATGRTTLIVTHDLQLASQCDKILFLAKDGRVDVGTHGKLLDRNPLYAMMCQSLQHSLRTDETTKPRAEVVKEAPRVLRDSVHEPHLGASVSACDESRPSVA